MAFCFFLCFVQYYHKQIMQYLNQLKNWVSTPTGAIITSSTFAILTAIRLIARGRSCNVDRDLNNKIIVVTGANTGIGKETIRELSKRPCTIIFGARDSRKSQETIKEILKENKGAKIQFFPLDLADKNSIKDFANKVKEQVDKIDILINNAGVMAIPDRRVTADGFEMQMGTNHFGHFYLTYLLWEKIKKSEEFRVINVSSEAHKGFGFPRHNLKIDFEDINYNKGYIAGMAYGRSKAANILFTRELQRRIDQAGLKGIATSLRPGVVRTELFRYMTWKVMLLLFILKPFQYLLMKSPREGAQTTLYLALEQTGKIRKGQYYSNCRQSPTTEFSSNLENAERLWKITERELGIQFII